MLSLGSLRRQRARRHPNKGREIAPRPCVYQEKSVRLLSDSLDQSLSIL